MSATTKAKGTDAKKKPKGGGQVLKPVTSRKGPPPEHNHVVVMRTLKTIKIDPNNANTHPPEQIEELRAVYREVGFTQPILLRPSGMIGAGEGRYLMAKAEGLAEVPTITLNLTDKQWRAYAIADNALQHRSEWDEEKLRRELNALTIQDVNVRALGFTSKRLADLKIHGFELKAGGKGKTLEINPTWDIIIRCKSEREQKRLLTKLTGDGLECRSLIG